MLLAMLLTLIPPGVGHAVELVKINDLVESAAEMDGKAVTIEGEAIGEVMPRGEFGWVNLHDGSGAMGIWAPTSLLNQLTSTGRYHRKGDTIRVTGVFFRMDPQNGGDTDIHARTLEIVRPGAAVSHEVRPSRVIWAMVWGITAGAGALLWWRRRTIDTAKER